MSAAPVQVPPSPMSLGDVFTTTFSVFRRRVGAFAALTALQQLVTVVALVVPVMLSVLVLVPDMLASTQPDVSTITAFLVAAGLSFAVALALAGIVSLYFTGMMVTCANEATQQRFPPVRELRRLSRGFVGRFVGLYLLGTIAGVIAVALVVAPVVMGFLHVMSLALIRSSRAAQDEAATSLLGALALSGLLALVLGIAAFVLTVKLAYIVQVCAVERLSWFGAVRRAWRLTQGSFWRTFGYLFVFSLLAGAVQQVVSFALSGMRGLMTSTVSNGTSGSTVLDVLQGGSLWMMIGTAYAVMMLVSMVLVPLRLIFVSVMYVDQFRREQLGPVDHAFAVTVPPYSQPRPYAFPQGGYPHQPGYQGPQPYSPPPQYGQAPYGSQQPYGQQQYGSQPGPYGDQQYRPQGGPYGEQPYGQQRSPYGDQPYGPQSPYGQG